MQIHTNHTRKPLKQTRFYEKIIYIEFFLMKGIITMCNLWMKNMLKKYDSYFKTQKNIIKRELKIYRNKLQKKIWFHLPSKKGINYKNIW